MRHEIFKTVDGDGAAALAAHQHVKRSVNEEHRPRTRRVATSVPRALAAAGIPLNDRRLPPEFDDGAWMAKHSHCGKPPRLAAA